MHALEHGLFFGCGALMWAPVVEVLPGPAWFGTAAKLGYIVAVRLIRPCSATSSSGRARSSTPFYEAGELPHGVSPLQDQGWAGTVMMLEGSFVTLAALAWLFLHWPRRASCARS